MKFSSNYLSKFTDTFVKKVDKFQALKELGNKKSTPIQIANCKARLTEEYKFWIRKVDNSLKENKLVDIQRDINIIRKLESKETFTIAEISQIQVIKEKYGL